MAKQARPYMAVLDTILNNDYHYLIKHRPVNAWKETLAILATYTGVVGMVLA